MAGPSRTTSTHRNPNQVRAFVAEFGTAAEDRGVRLFLRTRTADTEAAIRRTLAQLVREGLGAQAEEAEAAALLRRVVLLDRVAHADYPCLYAAADAFVLPTHGEGAVSSPGPSQAALWGSFLWYRPGLCHCRRIGYIGLYRALIANCFGFTSQSRIYCRPRPAAQLLTICAVNLKRGEASGPANVSTRPAVYHTSKAALRWTERRERVRGCVRRLGPAAVGGAGDGAAGDRHQLEWAD